MAAPVINSADKEVLLLTNATDKEDIDDPGVVIDDPYALDDDIQSSGLSWSQLDGQGKVKHALRIFIKFILLLGLLYIFICSLSFMSSAFRLLGGKAAGEAFTSNAILSNPIAGLMIGILVTVLVQSSSTSTSIVVSMVASQIIDVRPAIPIIMGANIGTSVTNTLVSLAQAKDRRQFRRAFAWAVVHDMFNGLCVLIILPIEIATGYLYHLTNWLVWQMNLKGSKSIEKKELLSKITKPFTKMVIQIDKKVIERIAIGDESALSESLVKYWCDKSKVKTVPILVNEEKNVTSQVLVNNAYVNMTSLVNVTSWQNKTVKYHTKKCRFLFHDTGMSDTAIGAIMLLISLVLLCCVLVAIVKLLHSMLKGQIAVVIRKTVNADFPKPFGFLTGYFTILVGAGMTFLVQSSSIFTSALTPLVGIGIVSLERIFPLTLGANIGTTGTSMFAAMASSGTRLGYSLQIALCHLFFNITGIIIWYPIPAMRKVPVALAKKLGNTTARYRWFAIVYIFFVFFIFPAAIFGLSLAGWKVFTVVMVIISSLLIFIIIVNQIQRRKPTCLPHKLRSWQWAPWCLRSLEPYDRIVRKFTKPVADVTMEIQRRGSSISQELRNRASSVSQELRERATSFNTPRVRRSGERSISESSRGRSISECSANRFRTISESSKEHNEDSMANGVV